MCTCELLPRCSTKHDVHHLPALHTALIHLNKHTICAIHGIYFKNFAVLQPTLCPATYTLSSNLNSVLQPTICPPTSSVNRFAEREISDLSREFTLNELLLTSE